MYLLEILQSRNDPEHLKSTLSLSANALLCAWACRSVFTSHLTSNPWFPNLMAHPCLLTHLFHQTHCKAEVVLVMVGGCVLSPACPWVVGHPMHSLDRAWGTATSPCSLDIHLFLLRQKSISVQLGQTPLVLHRTACTLQGTWHSGLLLGQCCSRKGAVFELQPHDTHSRSTRTLISSWGENLFQ